MARRGPGIPSRVRRPGSGQQSLFPNIVPNVAPKIPTAPGLPRSGLKKPGRTLKEAQHFAEARAIARGTQRQHETPVYPDPDMKPFPDIDPTRTSNPARPRTLQAGYDRKDGEQFGVLRVRFRDGTPWEYTDVPPEIWSRFKRSASPGRFINRVLNNYPYQRGSF